MEWGEVHRMHFLCTHDMGAQALGQPLSCYLDAYNSNMQPIVCTCVPNYCYSSFACVSCNVS